MKAVVGIVKAVMYLAASFLRWADWWLRPNRYPPGPRGPWAALNAVRAFMGAPYAARYYDYIRSKYGKVVLVPGPGFQFFVYIYDAEVHRAISLDWRNFPRADLQRLFETTVGTIIAGEGDEQHRRRQLINPLLERKVLGRYVPAVQEEAQAMLARWSLSGQKVRLAPELIKLLSGISARLLAGGANLEEGFGLQVVQLVAEFQKNPVGKTYKDTKRYVFQTVEALLEEARGGQMGILSVYAFEVSEGRMTTDQAVAEVTGFFNASVETTANLLAWLVYHLAQDPERWAKAQQEVDALFRGRTVVDAHELEQLSYLYQCADEAARLAPAVWRQLRKVGNSHMVLEYGERTYQLPQHAQVFNFVMHIQTDPQIWGPESKSFNPEGLTAERIAALPKGAFAPWSQGIHMCPGVTKSKMDLVIILAHILRTYQTVGFDERHQPVLGPVLAFPHHAEMWFVPRQR